IALLLQAILQLQLEVGVFLLAHQPSTPAALANQQSLVGFPAFLLAANELPAGQTLAVKERHEPRRRLFFREGRRNEKEQSRQDHRTKHENPPSLVTVVGEKSMTVGP